MRRHHTCMKKDTLCSKSGAFMPEQIFSEKNEGLSQVKGFVIRQKA